MCVWQFLKNFSQVVEQRPVGGVGTVYRYFLMLAHVLAERIKRKATLDEGVDIG
jgi:hypothetical protein